MAKKKTRAEKMIATSETVAAYLASRHNTPITTLQCMKELLDKTRELSNNNELTMQQLKDSLQHWVSSGWAVIRNDALYVSRSGQATVRSLAKNAAIATETC